MKTTDLKALKAKLDSNPARFYVSMAWIKFFFFLNFLIKKYKKPSIIRGY